MINGIAKGCELAGCALVGGETAELPGLYQGEDYDLAGFSVGVVEKSKIIDGSKVKDGDVLIGLASSGPHSNGYSLIRKILAVSGASFEHRLEGRSLIDRLMEPTRIYVKPLLKLLDQGPVHAFAHITGGGLTENIPRVLPEGLGVEIDSQSWPRPAIFEWLMQEGNVALPEMYRTFNMGLGMVACIDAADEARVLELLKAEGEQAWRIGRVVRGADGVVIR